MEEIVTAQGGLRAALGRGRLALDEWVKDGVLVDGTAFSASRRVGPQALIAAVHRGDLFSIGVRRRRYYVATLLQVEPEQAAAVCQALWPLSDKEKAIFWLRKHGALGARTAADVIKDGGLERVKTLAEATSAQAQATRAVEPA